MALLSPLGTHDAHAQGAFDWSRISPVQKLMARRAARLDALRELTEMVRDLPIGGGRSLGDLHPPSAPFTAGAIETGPAQYAPTGFCKLTMRIPAERTIAEAKRLAEARRVRIDLAGLTRAVGGGLEATGLGRVRSSPPVKRAPRPPRKGAGSEAVPPKDERQGQVDPREQDWRKAEEERRLARRDDDDNRRSGTRARREGDGVWVESNERVSGGVVQPHGQPGPRRTRKDPRVEAWEREWAEKERRWNAEWEQMRNEREAARNHPWARPHRTQQQGPRNWREMSIDEQFRHGRPVGNGWRQLPDGSRVRVLSETIVSRRPVSRRTYQGAGGTVIEETIEERVISRRFVVK